MSQNQTLLDIISRNTRQVKGATVMNTPAGDELARVLNRGEDWEDSEKYPFGNPDKILDHLTKRQALCIAVHLHREGKEGGWIAGEIRDPDSKVQYTLDDEKAAQDITDHWGGKILISKMKGSVSDWVDAIGKRITHMDEPLNESDIGLISTWPRHHYNSVEIDNLFNDLKQPKIYSEETETKDLEFLFSQEHRSQNRYIQRYFFRDEAGHGVVFHVPIKGNENGVNGLDKLFELRPNIRINSRYTIGRITDYKIYQGNLMIFE
jgi:hypothetical protein